MEMKSSGVMNGDGLKKLSMWKMNKLGRNNTTKVLK
jgi:hypothetical protein